MPKSESFAIATQQAHATGKAPKNFGTQKGKRVAKRKYDEGPSSYQKKADPSHKTKTSESLVFWQGFRDEIMKIAGIGDLPRMPTHPSLTKAKLPLPKTTLPKTPSLKISPAQKKDVPAIKPESEGIASAGKHIPSPPITTA